jgi:hypothetical protein
MHYFSSQTGDGVSRGAGSSRSSGVLAALVPILIYVVSAFLLYVETCMIASAMDSLRHVRRPALRGVTVCLLLIPLVLLPAVPVIMLLTLGYDCMASMRTLVYACCLWAVGFAAALPAYWYARRHAGPPKGTPAKT